MTDNFAMQEQTVSPGQTAENQFSARMRSWRLSTFQPTRRWRYTRERQGLRAMLREWHKRTGLFAFAFMAWLGASGILLNQSVSLGLDASRVDWSWLISMYGLHAEVPRNGFHAAGHWLVPTIEKTVLDGQPLDRRIPAPLGMLGVSQMGTQLLYVAASDRLVILAPDGRVIEQISDFNLPVASIRRVGMLDKGGEEWVAVQDLDIFVTADGISWQPIGPGAQVEWSRPTALPEPVREAVLPHANPSIAWEQVLIDLHSGRLFGPVGPWVINAAGLAAVVLSISGIWMIWLSNRRHRRSGSSS